MLVVGDCHQFDIESRNYRAILCLVIEIADIRYDGSGGRKTTRNRS